MKLDQLISSLENYRYQINGNPEITKISFDSRDVAPGTLFIAIKGSSSDGHDFIKGAVDSGASAILCEREEPSCKIPTIIVDDTHYALGVLSSAFYGHPSGELNLVGITGTNGKTTTVTLLHRLFSHLGYKCGLISTIVNLVGETEYPATHTTPDPAELNRLLRIMADEGCEFCFMEVSSHSIDQQRIAGLKFRGGIFSNITHDHLDYHKTFAEYLKCKKRFFDNLPKEAFALTNADDKNGEVMLQNCRAFKYSYSCQSPADFNGRIIEKGLDGMMIRIDNTELWTSFIGEHNAYNLLAIYGCAILLGARKEEVLTVMSALKSVAGRLEYLKGGDDITAVVDYAHTPDALENVLKTLRDVANDRELITVFGCGGNRDKSKRGEMGRIAAKYSGRVVVTSDNPRFEDPNEIISDIKGGMDTRERAKSLFIVDRREAIRTALALASKGAIVLVAGKGHETYQIVNGVKSHFDDKEIISEVFNNI